MFAKLTLEEAKRFHARSLDAAVGKIRAGKSKSRTSPIEDMKFGYDFAITIANDPSIPEPKRTKEYVNALIENGCLAAYFTASVGRTWASVSPEDHKEPLYQDAIIKSLNPHLFADDVAYEGPTAKIWQPLDDERPGLAEYAVLKAFRFKKGKVTDDYVIVSIYGAPIDTNELLVLKVDEEASVLYKDFCGIPYKTVYRAKYNLINYNGLNEGLPVKDIHEISVGEALGVEDRHWVLGSNLERITSVQDRFRSELDNDGIFRGAPENARTFKLGEKLTESEMDEIDKVGRNQAVFCASDLLSVLDENRVIAERKEALLRKFSIRSECRQKPKMKI